LEHTEKANSTKSQEDVFKRLVKPKENPHLKYIHQSIKNHLKIGYIDSPEKVPKHDEYFTSELNFLERQNKFIQDKENRIQMAIHRQEDDPRIPQINQVAAPSLIYSFHSILQRN